MSQLLLVFIFFFFNDTATTEIYTLSLHDALPIYPLQAAGRLRPSRDVHGCPRLVLGGHYGAARRQSRSEEHTSELQSRPHLVCRLLLEKKNSTMTIFPPRTTTSTTASITLTNSRV